MIMKRILLVNKTTSDTLIYNSLNVRDPMHQVKLMKVRLFLRLKENEFTKEFLDNLSSIDELKLGDNYLITKMGKIKANYQLDEINKGIPSLIILRAHKQIDNLGLIDSIHFCFDTRTQDNRLFKILFWFWL